MNVKYFSDEQLRIPPNEWISDTDYNMSKDLAAFYNNTLLTKYGEQEIWCFLYECKGHNSPDYKKYEARLLRLFMENYKIDHEMVMNEFRKDEPLKPSDAEDEEEYRYMLMERDVSIISNLLGYFRWNVLINKFNIVIRMEPIIDMIPTELIEQLLDYSEDVI